MATKQRNITMDAPINPAILPGLVCYTGRIDIDDTKTATLTIPAKSILCATSATGTTSAAGVVTLSTTKDEATIVFTAGATGIMNYNVIATLTEEISTAAAGTGNIVITSEL